MEKVRISFVVPVYKPKAHFDKCVKSLVDQALDSWEVIFVLDGPSTEARHVIGKYFKKKPNFHVVEIPHSGPQKARNEGAKYAQGDILCFFDSDCVIEPGASKMWVDQFDKKPEIGLIYSGYKFFGEQYAIESEAWDPWTLRVRNYISGCFPMRKVLYPGWTEGLKSLQDWDMWLSVVEKAEELKWDISKLGLFVKGYAFATAYPTIDSISGQGCTPENWLDRMDAVKKLHKITDKDICVSSLQYKHEGVRLAKLIGADYQDVPNDKPNRYKKIIQIGFSLGAKEVEKHSAIFQDSDKEKILFWTGDNIAEIYNSVSFMSIEAMSRCLNDSVKQYVEDKTAEQQMTRAGFKVEVLPLPLVNTSEPPEMPSEPLWAVDCSGAYGQLMVAVERSVPDMKLEMLSGNHQLSDYTGILHFFTDRSLSNTIKRAHLTGRHVISNVQQPFCGYVSDLEGSEKFIFNAVKRLREINEDIKKQSPARDYYTKALAPKRFLEVLGAK